MAGDGILNVTFLDTGLVEPWAADSDTEVGLGVTVGGGAPVAVIVPLVILKVV
jgi:hypothetical protein